LTGYWWSERIGPGFIHGYEVEILFEQHTPFQKLVIFQNAQWGKGLILDGIVQVTEGDEFAYHEMMTHVPLQCLDHAARSVLIIGGADGGVLRETLKYESVERVVLVELDMAVLAACRKYLPEICGDWRDPRVELVIGDGAEYVKRARESGESYDCIIIDSTDPIGPAIALFEPPFHRDVAACLSENGVIVRQSGLPVSMPRLMPFVLNRFLDVFPNVEVYLAPVPTYGGEIAFVAGSKNACLDIKSPKGSFTGRYYNPDCHTASFCLPTWWRDLIKEFELIVLFLLDCYEY